MKCAIQDCSVPATRHIDYEGASWYCTGHGICQNPKCGKSIESFRYYGPSGQWLCPCVIRLYTAPIPKQTTPDAGTRKPHPFNPKVNPDWTRFGFVRCQGEMVEDDNGNCVISETPEKWAQDYNCISYQGKKISKVGFENISGKWRKEVEKEDHRSISWSPPDGHISYNASTLPPGMGQMDMLRALDAENAARRAARGIDLSPLLPAQESVAID